MGNCRITGIVPPKGYRVDGIESVQLLDFDDFDGLAFDGGELYDSCLVTAIVRSGDFVELDAPDAAKYSSTLQNGTYIHTLETFIGELSAAAISALHLATKRRYLATFRTKMGKTFIFGHEAGATVSYVSQTADGIGSLVTVSAVSTHPIFERLHTAAACEWGDFTNIWEHRDPVAACEWGNFINVWEEAINAYSNAYSKAYNSTSPADVPFLKVFPSTVWLGRKETEGGEARVRSSEIWEIN